MDISIETILKLITGAIIGGIIGYERLSHGRPAGVRTHLLVCLASVIIMIVSKEYYRFSQLIHEFIRIDPARIAAGAIMGVGFLGAGVIIKSGFTIQGLTTAASIWIISAIGLAIGSGLYLVSFTGAVITFFTLWILRKAETKISKLKYKMILIVTEDPDFQPIIIKTLNEANVHLENIDFEMDRKKNEFIYHMSVSFKDSESIEKIKNSIIGMPAVNRFFLKS